MTTPLIGAPDWAAEQASPWTTENKFKRMVEAMVRGGTIEDRDLTAPPGSCSDGACYLIDTPATGAWAGQDGNLAIAVGANAVSGWYFIDVEKEGFELYIRDENIEIRWNGSAWVDTSSTGAAFAWQVAASDQSTALEVSDPAMTFPWPFDATVNEIEAFVNGASDSSGEIEIDIELDGTSVFSTTLTIDPLEKLSSDAAVPAVISTSTFTKNQIVEIIIINPGDGATGLIITFAGKRT